MTYESWDHFRRLAAERRESFCRSLAALLEVLLPGDGGDYGGELPAGARR